MKQVTLIFLVKKSGGAITEICLAMKKRGFGTGMWNGVGGKVEGDESLEMAAAREAQEEIGVAVGPLTKVAEIAFFHVPKPEWNQTMHVYTAESWSGEPTEGEEMKPQWYTVDTLPYDSMWPDDAIWVPKVLAGEFVRGEGRFAENMQITWHTL